MGWLRKYFVLNGRLTALQYWRYQVRLGFMIVVLMSATWVMTLAGGWLGAIPFALVLPVFASGVTVSVRRLHDRGKSAWWLALFAVAPSALVGVGAPWGFWDKTLIVTVACTLVAAALVIWFWIEIGFLRGQKGPNRYGPDPRTGA
jgi:uncharacterized membrane protein YhaH (DUF805 family)